MTTCKQCANHELQIAALEALNEDLEDENEKLRVEVATLKDKLAEQSKDDPEPSKLDPDMDYSLGGIAQILRDDPASFMRMMDFPRVTAFDPAESYAGIHKKLTRDEIVQRPRQQGKSKMYIPIVTDISSTDYRFGGRCDIRFGMWKEGDDTSQRQYYMCDQRSLDPRLLDEIVGQLFYKLFGIAPPREIADHLHHQYKEKLIKRRLM